MSRINIISFLLFAAALCLFSSFSFAQSQSQYPPWFGAEETETKQARDNLRTSALPRVDEAEFETLSNFDKKNYKAFRTRKNVRGTPHR